MIKIITLKVKSIKIEDMLMLIIIIIIIIIIIVNTRTRAIKNIYSKICTSGEMK